MNSLQKVCFDRALPMALLASHPTSFQILGPGEQESRVFLSTLSGVWGGSSQSIPPNACYLSGVLLTVLYIYLLHKNCHKYGDRESQDATVEREFHLSKKICV